MVFFFALFHLVVEGCSGIKEEHNACIFRGLDQVQVDGEVMKEYVTYVGSLEGIFAKLYAFSPCSMALIGQNFLESFVLTNMFLTPIYFTINLNQLSHREDVGSMFLQSSEQTFTMRYKNLKLFIYVFQV
jgi:hypothetical protein